MHFRLCLYICILIDYAQLLRLSFIVRVMTAVWVWYPIQHGGRGRVKEGQQQIRIWALDVWWMYWWCLMSLSTACLKTKALIRCWSDWLPHMGEDGPKEREDETDWCTLLPLHLLLLTYITPTSIPTMLRSSSMLRQAGASIRVSWLHLFHAHVLITSMKKAWHGREASTRLKQ